MSAGGAFGGSRGLKPVPPEKGVFPLDHFNECRSAMQDYMQCLKDNRMLADRCKHLSKKYLECRMEKNLMCKQDLKELGFKENDEVYRKRQEDDGGDYGSGGIFDYKNQPRNMESRIAGIRKKRTDNNSQD